MKTNFNIPTAKQFSILIVLLLGLGCENKQEDLEVAHYSVTPEVFIDGFSSGLNYAAFAGTVSDAFQVDKNITYNNSSSSMRFDVPNVNDPAGAYVGGSFFTSVARDLSGYDALTFWAKSSKSSTIDVVGFGNDFGANKYQTSVAGLVLSTTWKKYVIPIPDALKLEKEKGMFFLSEGPENNNGYSFWIDEVKFEKLGTVAHGQASILNGANKVENSFIGVSKTIDGLISTFNLPNGINQDTVLTSAYFTFYSSNPSVATVDAVGKVLIVGTGTAVITAKVAGVIANGSLTINSAGAFVHAPTPTVNASNVISIYTEAYPNVAVNYYNGYWAPYQTTTSADFAVAGDNVLNYNNFNFVGIEFTTPTVNATSMTAMHVDIYFPNTIPAGANFKIKLTDFGADGVYGGGNDTSYTKTLTSPILVSKNWVSIEIPFSTMTGLSSRSHLAQIVFEGTNISNFYADNIYFHN